jgi:hypothetical protein
MRVVMTRFDHYSLIIVNGNLSQVDPIEREPNRTNPFKPEGVRREAFDQRLPFNSPHRALDRGSRRAS